ncbi:hypothetical protein ACE1CM_05350 [Microseira sp. BLCC-F43]|jgi:hypothetical protein
MRDDEKVTEQLNYVLSKTQVIIPRVLICAKKLSNIFEVWHKAVEGFLKCIEYGIQYMYSIHLDMLLFCCQQGRDECQDSRNGFNISGFYANFYFSIATFVNKFTLN